MSIILKMAFKQKKCTKKFVHLKSLYCLDLNLINLLFHQVTNSYLY